MYLKKKSVTLSIQRVEWLIKLNHIEMFQNICIRRIPDFRCSFGFVSLERMSLFDRREFCPIRSCRLDLGRCPNAEVGF